MRGSLPQQVSFGTVTGAAGTSPVSMIGMPRTLIVLRWVPSVVSAVPVVSSPELTVLTR
jgi:hypothetical protein